MNQSEIRSRELEIQQLEEILKKRIVSNLSDWEQKTKNNLWKH